MGITNTTVNETGYILVHRRKGLENVAVEKMYIFCVLVNENKHLIPALYIMSVHTHGNSLLKGILTFASDIFPVLVFFSNQRSLTASIASLKRQPRALKSIFHEVSV